MQQESSIQTLGYDDMDEAQTLYVRSPKGRYCVASDSQVLALVDVRLLDHIVVTGQATVSLAERGQI